jgi:Glycoside-hydrolase family GH114
MRPLSLARTLARTAVGAAVAIAALASGPLLTADAAAYSAPPVNGVFDYQIGGAYSPAAGVQIVSRDRTASTAAGRYNICYVNAFQTQPGEVSLWPAAALLRDSRGRLVSDPGYPDEYLLDTRTTASRNAILGVLGPWFQSCKDAGYQAIEPDNLDSWTRSKRLLSKAGNTAMAQLITARAHAVGLAAAQKNTTQLSSVGPSQIGFDFAIAEECQVYDECSAYTDYYGGRVIEIEYTDNGGLANYNAACAARGAQISVIYRDRDVVPVGTSGYTYRSC